MSPTTAIRRAIYGKLAGDTTLNNLLGTPAGGYSKAIYHDQAPPTGVFPLIVFNKMSSVPSETMGDPDALQTDVWQVKAVDRSTTADTAESVADRIRVLLNDASLSVSGGSLLYLRRQSDIDYPELVEGVTYRHAGALYRVITEF